MIALRCLLDESDQCVRSAAEYPGNECSQIRHNQDCSAERSIPHGCVTVITDLRFMPSNAGWGTRTILATGNNSRGRLVRSMLRHSSKSSSTWICEMTRDGMDLQQSDDMGLLVEVVAPCRGEFLQHRNVYDGNGEYEFPIAHHYVPQYWRS